MYRIGKINVSDLSNNEVNELYATYDHVVRKYNLVRSFRICEEYKVSFLQTFCGNDKSLYIMRNESSICGMLQWVKSADWSGKELYKLTIYLCDSLISKDLSVCVDEFIQEKIKQYENFSIVVYNNELKNIMDEHSYKISLKCNYYTLNRENIDMNLLDNTIKECEEKNPQLTIKYTDFISEEYIQQYCDLFTETMEDMTDEREDGYVKYIITPDKQRKINAANKKNNTTHHCYMIFNESNEMIAKSNVSVNNNDPRFPYQFMIGVKNNYRGKNLGKWLYASMYKKLVEDVEFCKVLVCHHVENEHAINISQWIGYKFNYLEITYVVTND